MNKRIPTSNWILLIAGLILTPCLASAAAVQVNTTCEIGTCGSPDSISLGQSVGPTTFAFSYTFLNGDKYNISGAYSASFPGGTSVFFAPMATYAGGAPAVGNDVLTIDMFQNYFAPSASNWDGSYNEDVPLVLGSGATPGSTISGQLLYDGQSVGLAGPFGPGVYDFKQTKVLTGLNGTTLSSDVNFVFDFAAGTLPGASAASPAPEPIEILPVGLTILFLGAMVLRRRTA